MMVTFPVENEIRGAESSIQFPVIIPGPISFHQSTSLVVLAALDESICRKGIEVRMQVPAKCIVFHQAIPAINDSFAPA
jgi:hypothetical protein